MKKTIITMFVILSFGSLIFAQGSITKVFNVENSFLPTNSLHILKIDEFDNKWIGTNGHGLAILNEENGSWMVYNTENSPLPSNLIYDIVFAGKQGTWIVCFGGGVAQLTEDCTWGEIYTSENAPEELKNAVSIAVDSHNNKWIATLGSGLFKLDEGEWINYTTENSLLKSNNITSINIDKNNNKWLAISGELVVFALENFGVNVLYEDNTWGSYGTVNSGLDTNVVYEVNFLEEDILFSTAKGLSILKADKTWETINESNSCLPSNQTGRIAIAKNGGLFVGTGYPVLGFGDGFAYLKRGITASNNCAMYDANNSDLPNNTIADMAIDSKGDLWIATRSSGDSGTGGLAVFKDIIIGVEDLDLESTFQFNNYPNPCSEHTTITYDIPENTQGLVRLKLYDIEGRHIETLVEERQALGSYQIDLVTSHLPRGVYMYTLESGSQVISKKMIVQ